jgi:UDP-glucose 4-epimerase
MTWLITGGAGYIGSHIATEFLASNIDFRIFDNDNTRTLRNHHLNSYFNYGDIRCKDEVFDFFHKNDFEGVIHLAALKSVKESEVNPKAYDETNVVGTRNLIEVMEEFGVKNLIFSSTAAVYGETKTGFVSETTEIKPVSYYGKTKVQNELMLGEAENRFGLNYINLRYFNVAGCLNHELKDESTENLIPAVVNQVLNGQRPKVFGHDYNTPDGSAVRDFIHVSDIVYAHLASIDYLTNGGKSDTFNIGTGLGTSVLEIVSEIISQMESKLIPEFLGRRKGDIGMVVADPSKAEKFMGFKAQFDLSQMIASIL